MKERQIKLLNRLLDGTAQPGCMDRADACLTPDEGIGGDAVQQQRLALTRAVIGQPLAGDRDKLRWLLEIHAWG